MDVAPLRVGLIGCGFFAENHLAAWLSMDDVELTAVCDIDLEKARSAAERHSAGAFYGDAAEMLARERLDFVDIATTMESARKPGRARRELGLPTIVQKPLAPTFEDCVAIVEGTRVAGIPFMVHENTRFLKSCAKDPRGDRFRRDRQADLGEGCRSAPGTTSTASSLIWLKVENFVILDLGVHMLDVARFLMGEALAPLLPDAKHQAWHPRRGHGTILLQHQSGATSVVEASYASPIHPDPFPQLRVQVEGTAGSLRLDPGYQLSVFSNGIASEVDASPTMLPWSTPPWHGSQESVLRVQEHWVRCFREKRAHPKPRARTA